MGYWTKVKAEYKIKDRSQHPLAEVLRKTLEVALPELLASLTADGELDAYVDVKLDDAVKQIRSEMQAGHDYEAAKEIAFAELFPAPAQEIQEYEEEGGQQDAIDAFSDWVKRGSPENLED